MLASEIIEEFSRRGYQARIVSVKRVGELRDTIHRLREEGWFSPDFFSSYLEKYLEFDPDSVLPGASSVVITAGLHPLTLVRFGLQSVAVPPTYIYRDFWEGSLKVLTDILTPAGHRAARARLPLKTLAVLSGLGRYGRNNLCYVPGMGSHLRLGAFYTDVPCDTDTWLQPGLMTSCRDCHCCIDNCPTASLSPDRFLINADLCLTYLNEREGQFPDWVAPRWHNAVFGCMRCQEACPENTRLAVNPVVSSIAFSESETQSILGKETLAELEPETRAKLHELCLDDDYQLLSRNLGVLLNQE